jgi:hypothetical protein
MNTLVSLILGIVGAFGVLFSIFGQALPWGAIWRNTHL